MICEGHPHVKMAMKVREKCAYMSFTNDLIQCTIHFAESAVDTLAKVRLIDFHSAVREECYCLRWLQSRVVKDRGVTRPDV